MCQYIVRYRLKDGVAVPTVMDRAQIPTYSGYLGVQEKGTWIARFVVVRDGAVPTLTIYDAAAKIPVDDSMRVREIELSGYVEVGEFRPPNETTGRLTIRAKAEPRPNGFTVLVNDKAIGFDAPSAENKYAWLNRLNEIVEKYHLTDNVAVNTDTRSSLTDFIRKKLTHDSKGSNSSLVSNSSLNGDTGATSTGANGTGAAMPLKLDSISDFMSLPPDVINPLAPEDDAPQSVFHNQLFED